MANEKLPVALTWRDLRDLPKQPEIDQRMNNFSIIQPAAPLVVKVLRGVGRRIREFRGIPTFYHQCTALTTDRWNAAILPDVIYGAAVSDLIF